MTKQKPEKTTLAQKLKDSSTANVPSVEEGNTQFLRYLEAVYSTSKKLDEEVAAAINTKKEIMALVATLANTTRGLIRWGKLSGRVKSSEDSQTPVVEEHSKKRCGFPRPNEIPSGRDSPVSEGFLQRDTGRPNRSNFKTCCCN